VKSLNVLFRGKDKVAVECQPVPDIGSGEVLVQVARSFISTGTECICLQRNFAPGTHWDNWVKYPFRPGYSAVGVVIETADNVEGLENGDRVAVPAHHGQYAVLSADRAVKVPASVSDDAATWFNLACIAQNAVRRAEHTLGDDVVIIGAGILGQLAVQFVRLLGAHRVAVIDTAPARLALAASHGATHTFNLASGDAEDAIAAITDGRLADVVYDITGNAAVLPTAFPLARRFGKVLLLGDTGAPAEQRLTGDIIRRGVTLVGAHSTNPPPQATDYAHWTHRHMTELFFSYLDRGDMQVEDLIMHRYDPRDAASAYAMLTRDRSQAMGVLFDWTLLN
jgi:2-desacetyl-2-hydroxyethyl bacteriochlorophyllide A dehydrogenase